jgi:hypothetical protein
MRFLIVTPRSAIGSNSLIAVSLTPVDSTDIKLPALNLSAFQRKTKMSYQ